MHEPLSGVEFTKVNFGLGTDAHCAVTWFARNQKRQCILFGVPSQGLLRITRLAASRLRREPNLQEMNPILRRGIELAVQNAAPGTDVLQIACFNHSTITHRVLVFEFALDDVAEDFGIPVRMFAKSLSRLNYIVVDDAQRVKAHVLRIEIVAERERVPAVQPAHFCSSTPATRPLTNLPFLTYP